MDPVVDAATLRAMQAALEDVEVEDSVGRYIVALAAATRDHPSGAGGRLAARFAGPDADVARGRRRSTVAITWCRRM